MNRYAEATGEMNESMNLNSERRQEMDQPISTLIGKLNRPENYDDDLEWITDRAMEGCSHGLQGIGEFIAASGPQNDEAALPAHALCYIGNLVTDLACVVELCQMMKFKEKAN